MVSHGVEVVLAAAKTVTLVFGGVLTYLAYKAFRRTGSNSLRALMIGIGLLTTGALLSGLLHQIANVPLEYSVTVQSVFTALGFAVMTYSLFTDVAATTGSSESSTRRGA